MRLSVSHLRKRLGVLTENVMSGVYEAASLQAYRMNTAV